MAKDVAKLDSALKKAIQDGSVPRVRKAIASGGRVGPDDYGETALMDAAISGHLPVVRMLVEEVGQDINARSFGGATALIRAAISMNLEVIRYLVDKGADLNAAEKPEQVDGSSRAAMTGWESHQGTALIAAVSVGSLEIVRFLLERGAGARIRNGRGHDAFENAIRYNRPEIVDFFLERLRISPQTGFLVAARFNLAQMKRFVETLGVSAAYADGGGFTGLMASAKDGDYEFLEEGPHPGSRPDHLLVAKYLIEHGCPVNAQNRAGQTALMFAAGSERLDLVKFLVESGADPNLRDRGRRAALDYVKIPEAPPEAWENAYEAWCWGNVELYNIQAYLSSGMKAGTPPGGNPR